MMAVGHSAEQNLFKLQIYIFLNILQNLSRHITKKKCNFAVNNFANII